MQVSLRLGTACPPPVNRQSRKECSMATPFTVYAGASNSSALTDALFAPGSGITATSIVLKASGPEAVNLYDGSLAALGIGAGLLLTSGTTPGTSNTVGWFGTDNSGTGGFTNGDADIDA